MPQVTLKATRDFSYATRRLKVGEVFTVSERDAKVLLGIKRAELLRQPGEIEAPPQQVIDRAAEVTPQPAEAESRSVSAVSTSSVRKPAGTRSRRSRKRKA